MKYFAILFSLAFAVAACKSEPRQNPTTPASAAKAKAPNPQKITIEVNSSGYQPSSVKAAAGQPLVLVFKRTSDQGCGQELVFPERKIRRQLPLNKEVKVELTPQKDETISFTCGMAMYRGSIVVSAS